MRTIGLSGGLDLVSEHREYLFPPGTCHDSAAVLVEDGEVVAAIEEERLNRIKHTSKGAANAVRFCLTQAGLSLADVDQVVYYGSEEGCTAWMRSLFYGTVDAAPVTSYRQLIHDLLRHGVGEDVDDARLGFVHHHLAHAISAQAQSGFDECLVVTLDGAGDGLSGSVSRWRGSAYEVLTLLPDGKSLGMLYDRVIAMLGYGFTEEYKVMGLAPYGDPARFRRPMQAVYTLLPGGDYLIHWHRIQELYPLAPVRKRGEPILQEHKDVAAALQEALEAIAFHVLGFFRAATGLVRLCLAGGVAHNSTLNGKVLYSGLFREMFVQPASHDAGCALGAALFPHVTSRNGRSGDGNASRAVAHVYWGTDVGDRETILARLRAWQPLVDIACVEDVAERAAALLADGAVLGWVQGRSEFGPRALGNRSILADPRPAANRERVNAMVKKREAYRPFAPAVPEERAAEFFELSPGMRAPFMSFTVRVRREWRERLAATTHVDDTARIQTVSRDSNPRFWELLEAFGRLTGVAVLLNTSFNNDVEPIVDSVDDAVACFLTTGLDYLVVGEVVVSRSGQGATGMLDLAAQLPAHARLTETAAPDGGGRLTPAHAIANTCGRPPVSVSAPAHRLLKKAHPDVALRDLLAPDDDEESVAREMTALWSRRVVTLRPVNLRAQGQRVSR